jgi:ABC-2 type transport system permease protein
VNFEWRYVAMGAVTLIFSLTLDFIITTIVQMTAFWADNVWSLMVMLRFCMMFLGGGRIPINLFPQWAQELLHSLPFYHVLAFPVSTFMGDLTTEQWINGITMTVFWTVCFYPFLHFIWKRGNLRYTGVGM